MTAPPPTPTPYMMGLMAKHVAAEAERIAKAETAEREAIDAARPAIVGLLPNEVLEFLTIKRDSRTMFAITIALPCAEEIWGNIVYENGKAEFYRGRTFYSYSRSTRSRETSFSDIESAIVHAMKEYEYKISLTAEKTVSV